MQSRPLTIAFFGFGLPIGAAVADAEFPLNGNAARGSLSSDLKGSGQVFPEYRRAVALKARCAE
jgi:hypothetical protein